MTPLKWKSKLILAKVEPLNAYGVDAAPTGAADAMLMTDVELKPMEGEDVRRNVETPFMAAAEELPTGLHVVLTGSVELVGSGEAGVAPGWAPLARLLGAAMIVTPGATVEFVPVSDDLESGTLYFFIGPAGSATLHKIVGAAATGKLTVNAQGIPVLTVTITGLFVTPEQAARPVADFTKYQRPQVASTANTPVFKIGGVTFPMRNFELDFGCDVQRRLLVGVERVLIVDRAEALSATVEAMPLTTYDPYALAQAGTPQAIVLEHGTEAGRKVKVECGQAVQKRLSGLSNQQGVVEWPLAFTPRPTSAGDDQWKITLS